MKLDQPRQVRPGEELDTSKLKAFLANYNPEWNEELEVSQFPSGFSNLTYFVRVGDDELVLRRPPFGAKVKSGHDMGREFRVQKQLKPHFNKVAKVYMHCQDETIIGSEFYIMERVKGVIVRGKGFGDEGKENYPILADAWLNALVELHHVDYNEAGLSTLGNPVGYAKRQN